MSIWDEILDVTSIIIQFKNTRNSFYKVEKYSLKIQEIQKSRNVFLPTSEFGKKFKM